MLTQITVPTTEPVSLTELKLALRIDHDALDNELEAALSAARGQAEEYTGRSFSGQAWRLTRDDWWTQPLRLPRGPVDSVDSIEYLDRDGVWQTLGSSKYTLQEDFLYRSLGQTFPALANWDGNVRIEYSTGTWSSLPELVKRGIMMLAQAKVDALADQPELLTERALALLRPYRYDSGFRAA